MATPTSSYEISQKRWKTLRILAELIDLLLVVGAAVVIKYVLNQDWIFTGLYTYIIGCGYLLCTMLFTKNITLGLYASRLRVINVASPNLFSKIVRFFMQSLNYMAIINFIAVPANITIFLLLPQRGIYDFVGKTTVAYKYSALAKYVPGKESNE